MTFVISTLRTPDIKLPLGIIMEPIGMIHTPFTNKSETPIQSYRSEINGWVEMFPKFLEGLEGIEEFSHLYLLYAFNQSEPPNSLLVKPFLDDRSQRAFPAVPIR
jgi:tRNA (adenine37-N6)-methyltransferase